VGIEDNGSPCGTVLEAAKIAGYKTGLVVTSHLTDATPASFASHLYDRNLEDRIALQLVGNQPLGRVVDLMFGGGLAFFEWVIMVICLLGRSCFTNTFLARPNTTAGSARSDARDLISESKSAGVHTMTSRAEFDALEHGAKAKLPLMGVFAPLALAYEIDRDPKVEPSLLEMAQTALETLKRATEDSEKGFFIVSFSISVYIWG
jgi:alkaline phosphatase